jgi:hypothetical protein
MGFVCIMNNSFWGSFHNQASLALNETFALGFSYENRFNISELGTRSAGIVIPAGRASIGAIYSRFGYQDFRREMAGLACGIRLGEKIVAGVQADCFSERTFAEYSNSVFITCEAGIIVIPSDNIRIGLHLFNPVPGSLRKSFVPSRLRAGAGIDLSKTLFAGAEAEMSSGDRLIIRTGFDYEAVQNFRLRAGFSTENTSFSFGIGYLLKSFQLDLGFATHDRLGITSSASLVFILR